VGVCHFDNLFVIRSEYFYPKVIRLLIVLKYFSDLIKYSDTNLVLLTFFNPLVLELDIYNLAYHLCKLWIFYKSKKNGNFMKYMTFCREINWDCTASLKKYNEICLLIKYIKSFLWRLAERLSYIEDAWRLKGRLRDVWFPQPYHRLVNSYRC